MGKVRQDILRYLKKHKYCVLCTCSGDEPRATPVRYHADDDLKIMIYSENYFKKFKNLEENPNVSLALYNQRLPYRGLQVWGKAEIITHRDPQHADYLPGRAKRNPKMQEACKILNLIIITPSRIVLLDQLRRRGRYAVWEMNRDGKETERDVKTARELGRL
jgi:hypothetical protein